MPAATSARKAGIVGAVFGLIVVAVFVLAVRLTYHPAQPTGTASQPPTTTAAKVLPPASSVSAGEWVPSPGVAAAPTTSAQAPPKGNLPVPRSNVPVGLPGAAKGPARPAEPQSDGVTGGGGFVAGPKPAPAPAGTGHPVPDDSAPSLVPVIPQGPPPEVDPLVKAVLEADDPHHK